LDNILITHLTYYTMIGSLINVRTFQTGRGDHVSRMDARKHATDVFGRPPYPSNQEIC